MLGLSDTTLGAIVSVLLHAGVVVAFLGPRGAGLGAGDQVVLVSLDGVEVTEEKGQELAKSEPQLPSPQMADNAPGAVQVKNQPIADPRRASSPKRLQRASEPPKPAPSDPVLGVQGGGGLVGALYSQPRLISIPKPAYPPTARARGIEGNVGIRVSITAQGTVDSADVVQRSGTESFDIAARDSALQAHFQPALQGGVAAPSQKTIVVTFSLLE